MLRHMKLVFLLIATIALAAEPAQPPADGKPAKVVETAASNPDADKLKVREAQLSEMQTFWKYRAVVAELDKAHAATEAALAELAKRLNCTPDPMTLVCPAKPEAAKP